MGGGHTEILVGPPAAGFSDAENGHRHKPAPAPAPAPGHGHGHGLGIVRIYQEQAMDPLQQTLSLSDRLPVETTPATTELALYTRFSRRQKQFILAMVTWAGLFSPLTANIYFPALAELAADMGVSESRIDLTVTTYMVFQGISPTLFGGLADAAGRRPAFMVGFAVYLAANIGLALQSSYVGLAVLRCVQSMGCSGAIALGMGVLADISTNAERGMYVGFFQSGAMMGPSLGPLVGGLLVSWKGWRSIFFFLIVFCAIFLVPFLAFFPETGRSVVGDGSIRPWGWNRSLWNYYCDSRAAKQVQSTQSPLGAAAATTPPVNAKRFNWPNPLRALYMLGEKGVGLVLVYNAIIYTAFYDVATSTSALFGEIYGYNSLQIGLCFIPYGFGCAIACFLGGKVMDWNFRRTAQRHPECLDSNASCDLRRFPIEQTRIQVIWPILFVGLAAILCYGWALEVNAPVGAPLALQFLIGLCVTGSFNVLGTLLVDLYPTEPSTVTAANNLVRCLMGGAGTAIINIMIRSMGRGWCFTCVALICLCASPMLWLVVRCGPGWREERYLRDHATKK